MSVVLQSEPASRSFASPEVPVKVAHIMSPKGALPNCDVLVDTNFPSSLYVSNPSYDVQCRQELNMAAALESEDDNAMEEFVFELFPLATSIGSLYRRWRNKHSYFLWKKI